MKYDNWDAKEYEKASNMQYRQAIEAINRCHFLGNESILDVGCGDGKITHHLAMLVPNGKVIGCDLTEDMVNFASKKYKEVKNLSFVQESADQINYKEEFDYIVSFSCLHWVIDQVSVWRLFKQALKPNGKVIAGFQVDHEYFWDCVACI